MPVPAASASSMCSTPSTENRRFTSSLGIVRRANVSYQYRPYSLKHSLVARRTRGESGGWPSTTPETLAIAGDNRERLTHALEELPVRFREVLILRELEGCSYKEIAAITSAPIGTVMSSLARARQRLQRVLTQPPGRARQEASRGL